MALIPITIYGPQLTAAEVLFIQNLSGLSYAQGDVLYYNGTNLTRLAAGTSGYFLKTQGAAANPTWAAVAGAGTVTSVSVVTANGVSGTVATATTTPAITIVLGAITPSAVQISGLTASEIVITDASKNLVSAAVATYPSLTELTYLKGVTSAIQTQLGLKAPLASPTFTGTVTVPTPSNDTDASTKAYVDSVAQGLSIKESVQVATAAALPTNTYSNGASGVGATLTAVATGTLTVDGVAVALNDRVLVKDEVTAANNGIYLCTVAGTIGVAYVLTRSVNMNQAAEIPGAFTFTENGTVNDGAGFVVADAGPFTIGTTAINWTQFSGAGQITAGTGMTKTGNTLDVIGTTNRIVANADSIDISSSYVGQSSITTLGTITTGVWTGTTIAIANGGTGATTLAGAGILVSGGALGTPSSGTGTNITGIPAANILAGSFGAGAYVISTSLQVATLELGHATDTTLSRASAGVLAVEGVNVLTVAGGTLTGSITLGENTGILLDPAGSADGKYSGIMITGVAGETLAFGDLVYLKAADSRYWLTDADATATGGAVMIAMCVVGGAAAATVTLLLQGQIRADAKFPALTIGAPAYLGETAGAIQVAIPTGADNVIRVVGFALTADEIYFNPSQDHQITVA